MCKSSKFGEIPIQCLLYIRYPGGCENCIYPTDIYNMFRAIAAQASASARAW